MNTADTDSRHWSQRWLRVSIVDGDAVILFDLYASVTMSGCGRCHDLKSGAFRQGKRYRVQRFWNIVTCPKCGRMEGYGDKDRTLYLGDSREEALAVYDQAMERFMNHGSIASDGHLHGAAEVPLIR